ncbi:aspartyl/asparaginyl beta-hydroxylase domain-containing protein [Marinospirillum insulare]|uniref:LPS biosynthetic protein LpxO n=1 Tax=Marinospirillum insulare TaxID=217169 RepID=A0ABQ5ZUF4_9GAMM|nr:aspartyl/asparaginyl beta-hydroxylase domain-containing protein [Marinospirillum insulare]GLR63634.1 LPS biosynthetic protein LpxO [Marinospirillum insulare]
MGLCILFIFILCAIYVQKRGKVHHNKLSRKITDHSNLLAPINCLFYAFSKVGNQPYFDTKLFPQLKIFEEHWEEIRDEALALHKETHIKASDELDDLGFNSFFKAGWKRFYLKWYGANLPSAQRLCPRTIELINSVPEIKGAMFTMLPPGGRLVNHRDPYAGSIRYHLGLATPNSDECYIDVDGEKYSWRDGEAVMFDETYIHYAANNTEENRIIFFLDVKRPVNFLPVDWLNTVFSRVVLAASATKNTEGDKVGLLNKMFASVQKLRMLGKKLKKFSPFLYYASQYLIYALLIYLIFF